jgi:SOS-response transcriptional repressor LexA
MFPAPLTYACVEYRSGRDRRAVPRADSPGRRATDLPTTQQRKVLQIIERYSELSGHPCPASFVAHKLNLHHSTVQEHYRALHRKGWIKTPDGPASLLNV